MLVWNSQFVFFPKLNLDIILVQIQSHIKDLLLIIFFPSNSHIICQAIWCQKRFATLLDHVDAFSYLPTTKTLVNFLVIVNLIY
jgi:hypothetical protein